MCALTGRIEYLRSRLRSRLRLIESRLAAAGAWDATLIKTLYADTTKGDDFDALCPKQDTVEVTLTEHPHTHTSRRRSNTTDALST